MKDLTPEFIDVMETEANLFRFKTADALVNHVAFTAGFFTEAELDQVDNDLATAAAETILAAYRHQAEATAYEQMVHVLERGAPADDDDALVAVVDTDTYRAVGEERIRLIAQDAKRALMVEEERKAAALEASLRIELADLLAFAEPAKISQQAEDEQGFRRQVDGELRRPQWEL